MVAIVDGQLSNCIFSKPSSHQQPDFKKGVICEVIETKKRHIFQYRETTGGEFSLKFGTIIQYFLRIDMKLIAVRCIFPQKLITVHLIFPQLSKFQRATRDFSSRGD